MRNLISLFLFGAFFNLTAQRNTVFLEIGGNGGLVSLNYERQLTKVPQISIRLGVGHTQFDFKKEEPKMETPGCVCPGFNFQDYDWTLPISVQYLIGLKGNNFLETGLGYTWQLPEESTLGADYDEGSIHVFHASIGFRRHFGKAQKWMWKVNFTPIIGASGENVDVNSETMFWGGISLGKRF